MNILNDFDECKMAIINPDYNSSKIENFPKIGVTCFSKKIIDKFVEINNPEIIGYLKNTNGQVLHAYKLQLIHPTTNELMTFTAELPEYFRALLEELRGENNA